MPSTASLARRLLRPALGLVLAAAGAAKAGAPADFLAALRAYDIGMPLPVLGAVAAILPWLEVLCGAALLVDAWRETVRPLLFALCVVFVLMLGQAVARGVDLDCGCLGSAAGGGGWLARPDVALARAIVLLVGAWVLLVERGGTTPPAVRQPRRGDSR